MFTNAAGQVTGIDFSSTMIQGCKPKAARTKWPTLVDCTEALALAAEDEGVDPAAGEAGDPADPAAGEAEDVEALMRQREQNGWLTSYRTCMPERRSFEAFRKKFQKHRLSFSDVPLQAPRSRRPQEEQIAVQKQWAQRRSKAARLARSSAAAA